MKKAFLILLILFILLLLISAPFVGAFLCGKIENAAMRKEIISYVLENKDHIERANVNQYQQFCYLSTGLPSASVEYGYYFAPDDQYFMTGSLCGKGRRVDRYPDDAADWYYTERICENWFYYEIHDG